MTNFQVIRSLNLKNLLYVKKLKDWYNFIQSVLQSVGKQPVGTQPSACDCHANDIGIQLQVSSIITTVIGHPHDLAPITTSCP